MPIIARIKKIGPTLWTHKKKSVFAAACVGALFRYLYKRETDRRLFRGYCLQALQYGNEIIPSAMVPRRVTVLVGNHNVRTQFDKYALPLLNLAGLQVDVIVPQDSNQLAALASVINRNDADLVYVVGEDDSITRVLTGMLQPWKDDEKDPVNLKKIEARNLPPVGIFSDSTSSLKAQCEKAMAAIRGAVTDANVMLVKVTDADPLCVLNSIRWGQFADAEQSVSRYWYWGQLKHRFAYFWSAFKNGPLEPIEADVQYTETCPGCSKCYVAPITRKTQHWLWRLFIGKPKNEQPTAPDYSKIVNENCGVVRKADFQSVEFIVKNDPASATPGFDLVTGPSYMQETEFLLEGWARCRQNDPLTPARGDFNTIHAREVEVVLKPKIEETETENSMMVGGELMKLANFSIKIIPKAIKMISLTCDKNTL